MTHSAKPSSLRPLSPHARRALIIPDWFQCVGAVCGAGLQLSLTIALASRSGWKSPSPKSATKTTIVVSLKCPLTSPPRRCALKISPTQSTVLLSCLSCNSVGHHCFFGGGAFASPFLFPSFEGRLSPGRLLLIIFQRALDEASSTLYSSSSSRRVSFCDLALFNSGQHSTFFSFKVRMGLGCVLRNLALTLRRLLHCMEFALGLHTHVRRVTVAFEENNTSIHSWPPNEGTQSSTFSCEWEACQLPLRKNPCAFLP